MKETIGSITKDIFGSTYNLVTNKENKRKSFFYSIIIILIIYFFLKIDIDFRVMFGICFGIFVVYILSINNENQSNEKLKLQKRKETLIIPQFRNKNNEIINYLFSIQDFYEVNPQAYEDLVQSIDYFFDIYNETLRDPSLAGLNYEIMNTYKNNAINSLHSIIYKMKVNKAYEKKLEIAMTTIRSICDKYLDEIIYINNKYNHDNGINQHSKYISKSKVKAFNEYDEIINTFQIA